MKTHSPVNKILLVTHNLNLEGASYSCFYLAKGLKNRKFEVTILSPFKGPLLEKYKKEEIKVQIINFWSKRNILGFFKLWKFLKKSDFSIIYVNTLVNFKFILLYTFFKFRSKIIWCIRESEKHIYLQHYKNLKSRLFSKVDKVLFVSQATRKVYEEFNKKNNFAVIHNGIDISEVEEFKNKNDRKSVRKKLGFDKNSSIISIFGTIIERKGQLEFTKTAVSLLADKEYSNVYFLLVGGRNAPYQEEIEDMIYKTNNTDKIFIIPETKNVFDYYLISNIFVCNSFFESFPRVILEAMAFKLPIIASNVFGIPEQIKDRKSGLLIEPGNILMLRSAIKSLLNNKNLSNRLAKNAYRACVNNFSCDKMIEEHIKLFKKL